MNRIRLPISRQPRPPWRRSAALNRHWTRLVLTLLVLVWTLPAHAGRHFEGLAIVRSDGSLWIKGRVVRLYGIYLPPTERQCRDRIRPVRCDSRGVLALDFRAKGFIDCFVKHENEDGSTSAQCFADRSSFDAGEDLAAYLIRRGWALALPYAPFEYQALEKIASRRGVGVWGFSADSFSDPILPDWPSGR